MARRHTTKFLVSLTAGLILVGATLAGAQTCRTEYNALLRRYDTRCEGGTRSTTEYNSLMQRYDTTIRTPQGDTTRCTQEYNALLRQWVTRCR